MSKRRIAMGLFLIVAGLGSAVALMVHIFGGAPDVARLEPPVEKVVELEKGTYTLENECDVSFDHAMRECRDALDPKVFDESGKAIELVGGPSGSNRRSSSQRVPRYAFTVEKGRYLIVAPWQAQPAFRVTLVISKGDVFSGLLIMILLILGAALGIVGGVLTLLWPVLKKVRQKR